MRAMRRLESPGILPNGTMPWLRGLLRRLAVVASVFTWVSTHGAEARFITNLEAHKPQHIVIFGTSLSKGGAWVTQMKEALDARFPGLVTLTNGAKGGQNSRWGVANVEANVIAAKPDVVFVEFTINDSVARFDLPLEESRRNLETIIDRIHHALPDCEIILQLMNPAVGKKPGESSYRRDQEKYQQIYRDVGRERRLLVIDHTIAWNALLAKEGEAAFLKYVHDGVHSSAEGYKRFVTPTILKAIGLTEKTAGKS